MELGPLVRWLGLGQPQPTRSTSWSDRPHAPAPSLALAWTRPWRRRAVTDEHRPTPAVPAAVDDPNRRATTSSVSPPRRFVFRRFYRPPSSPFCGKPWTSLPVADARRRGPSSPTPCWSDPPHPLVRLDDPLVRLGAVVLGTIVPPCCGPRRLLMVVAAAAYRSRRHFVVTLNSQVLSSFSPHHSAVLCRGGSWSVQH
jgi:hypothetical protein